MYLSALCNAIGRGLAPRFQVIPHLPVNVIAGTIIWRHKVTLAPSQILGSSITVVDGSANLYARGDALGAFCEDQLLPPEILEPRRRQLGVPDGVLDIPVPEIGFCRARVSCPLLASA